MENKTIFIEQVDDDNPKLLTEPVLDGIHAKLMFEHLARENGNDVATSVFKNSYKSLNFFANPNYVSENDKNNLAKVLCLGRVQSGKTGFFISSVSLGFDNGYDIAYLIGGTKNTLKSQNFERIENEFENNNKVKIFDVNDVEADQVLEKINNGYKIVLVSLKNASKNVNLGKAIKLATELNYIGSIVVDDEGDEYTPGAPNSKRKNPWAGATHDAISELINTINNVTYLSVTATPQANFLISTIDEVSPDYAVLVEPGSSYTGGNAFHDTENNPHVSIIDDSDDFKESIPESFLDSLYFFIFCACLTQARGNSMPLSMLVHPSALKRIQNNICDKIQNRLGVIIPSLIDENNIANESVIQDILKQKEHYLDMNYEEELDVSDDELIKQLPIVANNLQSFVFNTSYAGKEDVELEKNDEHLYKIYVGGNMLGRGLTIKNLIVTYIYRDSKETAIDTLYQRARWLGYKGSYFDLCKVYMTKSLQNKFIATVENENDMWSTLSSFLLTNSNIKEFPRLFTLSSDEKLILTRKTVSKTVLVERVQGGYTYDKSLYYKEGEVEENRALYNEYVNKHINESYEVTFGTEEYQTHLIFDTTFTEFYTNFLSRYHLPGLSKFGQKGFAKILEQISEGFIPNELSVIVMRYKHKEYRSTDNMGTFRVIKELPQSYNNGTQYPGDKSLTGFTEKMHFQIHLVYTDKTNKEDYVPVLAFNNPITKKTINYVTGDQDYGSI